MARIAVATALGLCLTAGFLSAHAQPLAPAVLNLSLAVDSDDDDGNGLADGLQPAPVSVRDSALVPLSALGKGLIYRGVYPTGDAARLLLGSQVLRAGSSLGPENGALSVQALRPGLLEVDLGPLRVRLHALQVLALDGEGRTVDLARSHASLQRTPPDRLDSVTAITHDPDALRYVVAAQREELPETLRIVSRTEAGLELDRLERVALVDAPCPAGLPASIACRTTWPIRVVTDLVDKTHPLVADRSIRGELGGALQIEASAQQAQQIRIGGPRSTKLGSIERYRAQLRMSVLRMMAQGAPSVALSEGQARQRAQEQVQRANAVWGQCGISFGPPAMVPLRIVDPPPPFLVAVGCTLGTPASGGQVRLTVDKREVSVRTKAGWTPLQVARALQQEMQRAGFRVTLSPNERALPGAYPTVDLLVMRRTGQPAQVSTVNKAAASSDPSLSVCVGQVQLTQGLRHFLDVDSMTGTVEERTLLKWVQDSDPGTLDIVLIPAFERGGRIGESFVGSARSSLRNLVVLDRSGVLAAQTSQTLAHELGHVLLDIPGHPDDYGTDTSTLLMDSDASDPSAFGPRRLTLAECERALLQSGPSAPLALLSPWPWKPLAKGLIR